MLPKAPDRQWDCGNCMRMNQHSRLRNCEGKYPDSHFAKNGLYIGPLKIYECPKTYVSKYHVELINLVDTVDSMNVPLDLNKTSNRFIALNKLVKRERFLIQEQKNAEMKSKKQSRKTGGAS